MDKLISLLVTVVCMCAAMACFKVTSGILRTLLLKGIRVLPRYGIRITQLCEQRREWNSLGVLCVAPKWTVHDHFERWMSTAVSRKEENEQPLTGVRVVDLTR